MTEVPKVPKVPEAPEDPKGHPRIDEVLLIDDLAKLKTLADPLRVRILESVIEQARTTKQVAQWLGEKTTKLYHHVDALEKAGFLRLESTRQNRGTLEKYYRAVARVFRADSALFSGPSDAEDSSWQAVSARLFEQSATEILAVPDPPPPSASKSMRDPGLQDPDSQDPDNQDPKVMIANMLMVATEQEIDEILARLQEVVEEFSEPAVDTEVTRDQRYRLVMGFYPLAGNAAGEPSGGSEA